MFQSNNMMMNKTKYLPVCYLLFLIMIISCNSEEDIITKGTTLQIPFEIEIPNKKVSAETRADDNPLAPQEPGTCNVNRIKVLVFKAAGIVGNTMDEMTKFIYETTGVITEQPNTAAGKYKGKGHFTAEQGASYRVIAFAYLDSEEQYLNIDPNNFTGKDYRNASISLKVNNGVYNTPEFFKGILRDETAVTDVIVGDGELKLKGFLYRAIGRANIEINNIPDDVTKLEFAVDRYSPENYLYDDVGDMYIGFPVPNTLLAGERVLASTTDFDNTDVTKGRTAHLSADMLRLHPSDIGSIFYIKASRSSGVSTYIIMSADKWIYTDYVGILEKVISSNRFIIPTNYQLNIYGDFSALKTGNIMIEYSDEITDEVKIGILTTN